MDFFSRIFESFFTYIQTTPIDIIAAHILIGFGWFPIFGIIVWGLIELWKDHRQGIYASKLKWAMFSVSVPQDAVQTPKGMENFFSALAGARGGNTLKDTYIEGKFTPWISFEIVSNGGQIGFYVRMVEKYRDLFEASLYAQYPEAQITQVEDYTDVLPDDYPNDDFDLFGGQVVLKKPEYIPLRTWSEFEHMGEKDQRFKDPLLSVLEVLGRMKPGEYLWIQFNIRQSGSSGWRDAGEQFVKAAYGKEDKPKAKKSLLGSAIGWIPLGIAQQVTGNEALGLAAGAESADDQFAAFKITPQEKEVVDAVVRKISKVGWQSKIRWVYGAKKEVFRKGAVSAMMKGVWSQYGNQSMNQFGMHGPSVPNDDYPWTERKIPSVQKTLIKRYKKRSFGPGASPYHLNVEEVATLFHFPAADARTPVLTSLGARRSEAPRELNFAGEGEGILMNVDRSAQDMQGMEESFSSSSAPSSNPTKLATPTPARPSALSPLQKRESQPDIPLMPEEIEQVPKVGMPAPLPPGLDISPKPIQSDEKKE